MSKVKSQKSKVWKRRFFINTLLVAIIVLSSTFAFAQPKPATPAPATSKPTSPVPAAPKPTTTPAKPTNPAAPKAPPDPASESASTQPAGGLQLGSDQRQPLNLFLRDSLTVKALWSTILRIADTFVVLFLLAIAFATILHISYDTYGIKKAILPLIIGIILSHFSLVIVQNFTDFAQVMSAGMYNAASGGDGARGLALNLGNTFFTGGLEALGANGGKVTSDMLIGLFAFAFVPGAAGPIFLGLLVLALIMIAIPTLLILVLSFLLYARFYLITVLTIIAPLAWLTIMWSPVQGFFKTWWKQFTQWVFMAPVALFFLWLAIAFSQSSMANGEANFGTYLLSLVMLYLAIQTPFKMGGQVTATMSKYAQSKALPVAKKAVGGGANAGLNAWGRSRNPFDKQRRSWAQTTGIMGLDSMKEGAKIRWGAGNAKNKTDNVSAFVGLGPGGNKQRAEQLRKKAQQERIESEQFSTGTGADRIQRIQDGSIKNPEDALTVIEMMAQKGEDAMGALEAYIKNTKYTKDGKTDPRDADPNFAKRWNNAVMYTKPWLMHTTNPGDKPADTATAEEKAAYAEKKKPIDDQQRVIDAWVNFENVMKNSAKELGKVGRIKDGDRSIVADKIQEKIDASRLTGNETDIKGVTYTTKELEDEKRRVESSANAKATHIDLGNINDASGASIKYHAGEQSDLLRRVRNDPVLCRNLEAKGAASPILEVTREVQSPPASTRTPTRTRVSTARTTPPGATSPAPPSPGPTTPPIPPTRPPGSPPPTTTTRTGAGRPSRRTPPGRPPTP